MATLTQVSITARKTIRYTFFFIIFLIVGRMVLGIGIGIFRKIFPPKAPPPTVAFNKLPKIPFPAKDNPNITYTIQTPTGDLPTMPTQAKVYVMPRLSTDLLSLATTKTKAASLGFPTQSRQISQTVYEFKAQDAPSTLNINISNQTFSVSYDLGADSSPIGSLPPTSEEAASNAKQFLTSGQTLPDDLTGPVTNSFLKIQGKSLVDALSLSEANFTKVNLFRKDYDKIPAVTANYLQANVWFLISGNNQGSKRVIGGEFHYFPVDEKQVSTYPLKTAQAAVDELKAGKAYVANMGENNGNNIIIRDISLAYYDPNQEADFYQPVYVFKGDRNFAAYLPAITSQYQDQ